MPLRAFDLRPGVIEDANAIARVFRRARQTNLPYLPELHSFDEDHAFFKDVVLSQSVVWVAEIGSIVGFIAWRAGWVDHLYVDAGQHGRGIGTALLALAMRAEPRLDLWAFQKNTAALAFYRKRGFRVVRQTDGRDNEEKEPDVLLAWERGQSTGA